MQQLQESDLKKLSPQYLAPLVIKTCAAEIVCGVNQCPVLRATNSLVEVS